MRFTLSIAIGFSLLTGLSAQTLNRSVVAQTEVSSEEYEVYDAAIDDLFVDGKASSNNAGKIAVKTLVIMDRTRPSLPEEFGREPGVGNPISPSLEANANYRRMNQQSATLKRSFKPKIQFVMFNNKTNALESNSAPELKESANWQTITLSRIGFNSSHTEAVFSMSYWCGGLCGGGFAFYIVKENGLWKVNRKSALWEA